MGKLSKFTATIIAALAFTILTFSGSSVSAKNVALTATVKDAVSITTGGDITFDLTPNQFNTGSTDVSVSTTNSTGYTLYVTSTGTDHSGDATTSLVHTSLTADSSNVIESLSSSAVVPYNTSTGTYDGSSFDTDKWGIYVFAAGTAESPITDTSTSRTFNTIPNANRSINSSNTQVQADKTEVTVGAKVGLDILAGTYENTLTFTALANSVPYTYTINYSGNASDPAASIVPDATVQIVNDDRYPNITITSGEPTRTGYKFLGWTTSPTYIEGTDTLYQPGDTISMDYEDPEITLYAQWEELYQVTIANSNTTTNASTLWLAYGGTATVTVTPASGYYLSSVSCPSGYTCTGYNTSTSYTGTQTITIANNNTTSGGTLSFTASPASPSAICGASAGSTCTVNGVQYIRLADGNVWTKNSRGTAAWANASSLCPSGTSLPTAKQFDDLLAQYGGVAMPNNYGPPYGYYSLGISDVNWSGYYWSATEDASDASRAWILHVSPTNSVTVVARGSYNNKVESYNVICIAN